MASVQPRQGETLVILLAGGDKGTRSGTLQQRASWRERFEENAMGKKRNEGWIVDPSLQIQS